MALIVYALCALTAFACAALLLRGWRRSRSPLLLWSGLCFALLTLSNAGIILDRFVVQGVELWPVRHGLSLLAISVLVYGLIFEEH